jgi:hypothetical protein
MHKFKTRKQRKNKFKYASKICNEDMSFSECELAILRNAIDESEELKGRKITNDEEVQRMLGIVEQFIIEKKLLLYGGTAINNILPKFAQFYNRDIEVPDYDFYSPDALNDAKELADIFYKEGYLEVEAKAGMHMGTFKVYVNFISIADITQMHQQLYKTLLKDSIVIAEIHYTPPNYLRMSMYLELSRPSGDISRWEKIFKRLALLNKYYPFKTGDECQTIDFHKERGSYADKNEELYVETRECFINQGVVFFGGYASSLYSRYMPKEKKLLLRKYPDFDVLSDEPDKCALILKEHLHRLKFKKIAIIKHDSIGEIIPYHIEIKVENKTIAFIYKPIACHSYNKIIIKDKEINIATIDTILAFYLSFWYSDLDYYDKNRLLCLANFLFEIEQHNRLEHRGILKRFSINCYGKQMTLEDIRSEKAQKYRELVRNRKGKEYEMWFLKYSPHSKGNKEGKGITDTEIEKSIQILEENKKQEKENVENPVKREKKFIERFIGSIRRHKHSKRSSSSNSSSNKILRMFQMNSKTRKNRSSEFLF